MSNREVNQMLQDMEEKNQMRFNILRRMILDAEKNNRLEHEALYRVAAYAPTAVLWMKFRGWAESKWARFSAWFKTAILRRGVKETPKAPEGAEDAKA